MNCNRSTISHHLLPGLAILFVFNQQSSSIQCCSIVYQCGLKTKLIALLSFCHCKPGKHFKLFAENPKGTSPLGRHRPSTQRTQRAARKTHGLPTNKEQSLRRREEEMLETVVTRSSPVSPEAAASGVTSQKVEIGLKLGFFKENLVFSIFSKTFAFIHKHKVAGL